MLDTSSYGCGVSFSTYWEMSCDTGAIKNGFLLLVACTQLRLLNAHGFKKAFRRTLHLMSQMPCPDFRLLLIACKLPVMNQSYSLGCLSSNLNQNIGCTKHIVREPFRFGRERFRVIYPHARTWNSGILQTLLFHWLSVLPVPPLVPVLQNNGP